MKTNIADANDPRLKIIEADDQQIIIEFCGFRITGDLLSANRGCIGVQISKTLDEHIYLDSGKTSVEWTQGDHEMLVRFDETHRALGVARAIKTIGAYLT